MRVKGVIIMECKQNRMNEQNENASVIGLISYDLVSKCIFMTAI